MKKVLAVLLAIVLAATAVSFSALAADDGVEESVQTVTAVTEDNLYVHASKGSKDTEAWVKWYEVEGVYYFFLPSSVTDGSEVEIYSSFGVAGTLDGIGLAAGSCAMMKAESGKDYTFTPDDGEGKYEDAPYTVRFMFSSAESAIFVNNTGDFGGMDLLTYLQEDKENSASATGAFTHTNGTVTRADIKKMKGRGNTSWEADKKGFNITFKDAVEFAGMKKCKKYSLVSNFQDAAMARSRILYDLSGAVGMPYSPDSRFVDLYTNGVYQGTYQACLKIEVGKNALISDFGEDDYLDKETGGVKKDFSFVTEIDSSPAEDDFHFSVQNGNNLTMKSPELSSDDPNLAAVRGYVKGRFNTMFNKLNSKAEDVGDYIDLDSLAKSYIINELGKNWDSGATSFFLTYKPDSEGVYKFYAAPVWDFDNTLGNARGIEGDLKWMGIKDYTLPTGWFATKKGGYNGPNFLATAAKHPEVMKVVYRVWFEDFLPAIETLNSEGFERGSLYSSDVYREILADSAAMNYMIWELDTDSRWIADHSSLLRYSAQYTKNEYGQVTAVTVTPFRSKTTYDQYTFDGQFDYMMDWLNSRTAWISGQYVASYEPTDPAELPSDPDRDILGDVNLNGEIDIIDATEIQRHLAGLKTLTERQLAIADTNRNEDVDILDATCIQRYLAGLIAEF